MPLLKGKENVGHNIAEMEKAGHPRKQAIAAAYHAAGVDCLTAALDAEHVQLVRDMKPEDWMGVLTFIGEEMKEPEHARDGGEVVAAGVLFVCQSDYDGVPLRVLLLKRSLDEDNYAGYWSIPGGGVDEGETPEQATTRECREEIGQSADDEPVMEMYHDTTLERGDHHYTFRSWTPSEFAPTLNAEHTEFGWFPVNALPKPMHPGVRTVLDKLVKEEATDSLVLGNDAKGWRFMTADRKMVGPYPTRDVARTALNLSLGRRPKGIAYDKVSTRIFDADGRLHIERVPISKACVSPYLGREIPGGEELGLEQDRVYHLLRDPLELAKAAPTFNGVPLMIVHESTAADDHAEKSELVVGSTGSTAQFDAPYLYNALAVWPQHAIEGIEDKSQTELSCGYYYRADMTPGTYEGVDYDGVMRDIVGNHVALVKEGRAGPDVAVGDRANPATRRENMKKVVLSRTAIRVQGALDALILPKLAKDKKPDWLPVLKNVTRAKVHAKDGKTLKPDFLKKFVVAAKDAAMPMMTPEAQAGGGMGPDDVIMKLVEHAIAGGAEEPPEMDEAKPEEKKPGEGGETGGKYKEMFDAMCAKGMNEDDATELAEMFGGAPEGEDEENKGEDEDDEEDNMADDAEEPKVGKKAMDKAIAAAVTAASVATEKRVMERQRAVQAAIDDVAPWVGRVRGAHDNAEKVYRGALDSLGVKCADVKDAAALKHILHAQPKPDDRKGVREVELALDSDTAASLAKRFPHADKIGVL